MGSTLRLGIIGCGWQVEHAHLPVLAGVRGVRVVAACDRRFERLELMKRRFAIPRLYQGSADFLSDRDLDAILVATPGDSHAWLATAAVETGRHVLVEKPLALTVDDAEALAATARRCKVTTMVGLNFRFHPLAVELKGLIQEGAVGRPLAVFTTLLSGRKQRQSVTGYEDRPEQGGGVFYDKLVHTIDLLRFLFDCEVATGESAISSVEGLHEAATVEIGLENGVRVLGYLCTHAIADMTCCIIGDEGKVTANFARPAGAWLYRVEFSRSRIAKLLGYARQIPRLAMSARLATPSGRLSSYRNQWRHFVSCIESGSRPRPDFEDGLRVARTIHHLLSTASSSSDDREAPIGEATQCAHRGGGWGLLA